MNLSSITTPALGAAGFLAGGIVASKIPPMGSGATAAAAPSIILAVGGHFLRKIDGPAVRNFGGGMQLAGAVGLVGMLLAKFRGQ